MASSPAAAAATLRTRAANADATDEAEADALGRSAVLDLPDDETYESIDLAPGADAEADASPQRRQLLDFARRAEALTATGDTKLDLLIRQVKALLADGFNPVIFCRFIDTAEYVADRLATALPKVAEVGCVTGALPPEERAARIADLGASAGKLRPVLVATDCLSEGVNLQEHFQAAVHYDLAWNPTRHEQREGRVDRFGQRATKVRAVTIYGTDNRIDEIVLRVLLRKHEQIRKALGIAVPVPDVSDDVLTTIAQELLVASHQAEQLVIDGLDDACRDLHVEWDSAAAKEKESRERYAQRAIKPDEVAAELAEIRASLGSPTEVADLCQDALAALHAEVRTTGFGFSATTAELPQAVRDAFPPASPAILDWHRDLPTPPGAAHLDRTDPHVGALARYLVESALDPTLPAALRPARRTGVLRTSAVTKRTTLLLIRVRLHLTLPPPAAAPQHDARRSVAEEARLLAFRGAPASAEWLTPDEVEQLRQAAPTGNVASDQAAQLLGRTITGLDAVAGHIAGVAGELADALRASHIRVREAVGQRARRRIEVAAQHPADLLGVYVYLPEVDA